MATNDGFTLIDNKTGKKVDLPRLSGTVGPDVADIRALYSNLDVFTYDPGFTSTGSCKSAITYIDGDVGILLHRGYPIEQLAEHSDFLETAYVILYGELPNAEQSAKFRKDITYHSMLQDQMNYFYRGFRRDAHPMAVLCGVVGAMAAFYHDSTNVNDPASREIASFRLIAKMPTITAWAYKYSQGQPFIYPNNKMSYAENFLHMMFATPCEEYKPSPVLIKAMDRLLILHADHEQNASTLPCVWLGRQVQTPSPVSPPVSPRCGGLPMAVPMKRCCKCCTKSVRRSVSPNSSSVPRTRTIRSV